MVTCVCMEGDPATLPLKLFWGLVSPGQGHALGSFPLSMSGQDWLAAECSVVEDLQEFGICFRANEKNQTDGQVRGREVLPLLFTDGDLCGVSAFIASKKLLTKESCRRTCSDAGELVTEVGGEKDLGLSMQDWSLPLNVISVMDDPILQTSLTLS